jgi:sporulation protein YlmC with PRC-barrel domain
MTHNGSVGTHLVPEEIHDIRGTTVRGADNTRLGEVVDVIVDHETMEIRYLVVDGQGRLDTGIFLLPADRISADANNDNNLAAGATRQQIEDSPHYRDQMKQSQDQWKKYEQQFKKYWDEEPVMHLKGSDRIITTQAEQVRGQSNVANQGSESEDREVDVARLFPERMAPVFSDTAPGSGKVTLRPKPAARAEEAASGVSMLKPHWWESFENYLRVNKDDIQAKCSQCSSKAA